MNTQRKVIFDKLTGFMSGAISKPQLYEWALFVVVSNNYEELVKNDKLAEQILQFVIDIDKPQFKTVPLRDILEYFVECLEGRREFSAEQYKILIETPSTSDSAKAKRSSAALIAAARFYALIFIFGSILLNATSLIKPDLLVKANEIPPTPQEAWKAAAPHLFYAILMLWAMFMKLPRMVLYAFIPIGIWGMFFYWTAATSFALRNSLTLVAGTILFVCVALPPTAAFFVLLMQWFSSPKKIPQNKKL